MIGFSCECFICETAFVAPLPTVFCSDACRAEASERHEERMAEYYAQPDAIWPGDKVRLLTGKDFAFQWAVLADVRALP